MFVIVGVIGALLLVLFLVFDDVLDGILPDADWISGPIIGAFLAAFGIVGWTVTEGFEVSSAVGVAAGVAGGIGIGYLAYRVTKSLIDVPTDATLTRSSFLGREGRVVTGAAPGQLGEILVSVGGHSVKLSAVSADELERGAAIVVIDVPSPTKVVVQPADRFWASEAGSA